MIENKVNIEVIGKQHDEEVKFVGEGKFIKKGESTYLEYIDDDKIKNHFKIEDKKITVTKYTEPVTNLIFEEKVPYSTKYNTPYGALELTILTNKLEIQKSGLDYDIKINFMMVIAGGKVEKQLNIKIKST